jgi:PAS domain-containing protein
LLLCFPAGLDKLETVMRKVDIQFLDQGFHRVLFNAMPLPVFVVDGGVCILEYNAAAARLLKKNKRSVIGWRCGEVLCCLHSQEVPDGCGHAPACRKCVVRGAVRAASRGHRVARRKAEMVLVKNGKRAKVAVRVSCQPFTYGRRSFILLVLEGLND